MVGTLDPQNRPGLQGMKRGPVTRHVRFFTRLVREDKTFYDNEGYLSYYGALGASSARNDFGPFRLDVYTGVFEINWDGRTKGSSQQRSFLLTEDQKDIRLWTACSSLGQEQLDFYATEARMEYGW